jgi:FkbM family methyltransferase
MPDELFYLDHKITITSDEPVLVDVGGHHGWFTEHFLKKYSKCHAIIFEPIQKFVEEMREKFKDVHAEVYAFGIGETLKWSDFYEVVRGAECSGVYFRKTFGGNLVPKPIISLDMCYPTLFDHIDYLKVDVEGNEYNVFKGAKRLLENRLIRYLQFEYGDCYTLAGRTLNDVIQLLMPNYRVFHKDYGYVDKDFNLSDALVRNFMAEAK